MGVSFDSLRNLAGSTQMTKHMVSVPNMTSTEVLPENFDRLAWILGCFANATSYWWALGSSASVNDIQQSNEGTTLMLDHAHFGPMVGQSLSLFQSSGGNLEFVVYELVLIKG